MGKSLAPQAAEGAGTGHTGCLAVSAAQDPAGASRVLISLPEGMVRVLFACQLWWPSPMLGFQQPQVQVMRLWGGWQHPTAGPSPGHWMLPPSGAWCCQAEADPQRPASPEATVL